MIFGALLVVAQGAFAQLNTPKWVANATIYEVNVRQFSKEGTFKALEEQLPRLEKMGVDILWLMPIHPIGEKNRKGSLGSYYAVRDYRAVNPEFGTFEDFRALVETAHGLGMKVIIDWVANHTSPDHVWVDQGHQDWYTLDSLGQLQPTIGTDWWDVADLNYDNEEMRREMISCMQYWVQAAKIDGYRCDVAGWVPMDFWKDARASLDAVSKNQVFMLAEAEGNELHDAFEATYGWEFHHILNDIAQGKKDASAVHDFFSRTKSYNNGFHMNFTSNHDENSWNGTEMERMGEARFAMAVIAATIEGMPLVYNGQETSLDRRLAFFEKDEIDWSKMDQVDFYQKLLQLHQTNPALFAGAGQSIPRFISNPAQKNQLVFVRERGQNQVLVVINLSATAQQIKFSDAATAGVYQDLFDGKKVKLKSEKTVQLPAWGYKVYYR
ncbi:MAG: alpha-amylase family glycosyl hydrolase [Flavobacteriales bacterium]